MSIEVNVSVDWLKQVHRDLDACQKVIWLAGCRPQVPNGFDPSYVTDAQARLKEIEARIATATVPGQLVEDEATESQWRNLALQFDGHRMQAMALIKLVATGQATAADCATFAALPPIPAHQITVELATWEQRAVTEATRAVELDTALVALKAAITPQVIDWVRCGLATNGRLIDGTHPALAAISKALSGCAAAALNPNGEGEA